MIERLQDVLFCPTVPHTGTTFLIEFLRSDPAIVDFKSLRGFERMHGEVEPGLNLVHTHFEEEFLDLITVLASRWPIIVSLRDPLLSVLSAYNRNVRDHTYLVEQFVRLVEMIDKGLTRYTPIYVPVDLMEKLPLRRRVQQFVDTLAPLDYLNQEHCLAWARRWPRIESQGPYSSKSYYNNRQRKRISRLIPKEWDALVAARPVLQPFLEAQGYKDLLWWSDR